MRLSFSYNSSGYVNLMKYNNKKYLNAAMYKLGADLGVFTKYHENSGALGATGASATKQSKPRHKIRPRPTQIYEYTKSMVACEKLAAKKLGWTEYRWAGHCLTQDLNRKEK